VKNTEAHEIISGELATYRKWSYDQLRVLVDAPKRSFEVVGASGTRYYVDIYVYWDARPRDRSPRVKASLASLGASRP
jgi:hypothetical protein